jgi:hypothetical protein
MATRTIPVVLAVTSLVGCLPGMIGLPRGADQPKKVVVTAATMAELVERTKQKGVMGSLPVTLSEDPDLYERRDGGERLSRKASTYAHSGNAVQSGVFDLGFASADGTYICFAQDYVVPDTHDADKYTLMTSRTETWKQVTPWVLYTVASLEELAARPTTWPPPEGATSFSVATVKDVYVNTNLKRVALFELCAPKVALTSGHYLVIQSHHADGAKELDRTASHHYLRSATKAELDELDQEARFGIDSLAIWKIAGESSAPTTTADKRKDKPPARAKPGKRGEMSVVDDHPKVSDKIVIEFSSPMTALPGERYWITVVELGAKPDAYTTYEYLAPDAESVTITAPAKPGLYDVRLHGNYPTKTTNLLQTIHIQVMKK